MWRQFVDRAVAPARRVAASVQRLSGRVLVFLLWVLSREQLPDLQVEPRTNSEHTPALGPDSVEDPTLPKSRGGIRTRLRSSRTFVSWLLSAEECPHSESTQPQRGAGFVRVVVASEPCPSTEEQALQRRSGFLRWLLTPEEL